MRAISQEVDELQIASEFDEHIVVPERRIANSRQNISISPGFNRIRNINATDNRQHQRDATYVPGDLAVQARVPDEHVNGIRIPPHLRHRPRRVHNQPIVRPYNERIVMENRMSERRGNITNSLIALIQGR